VSPTSFYLLGLTAILTLKYHNLATLPPYKKNNNKSTSFCTFDPSYQFWSSQYIHVTNITLFIRLNCSFDS